jgi:hypothetical protein
MRTKKQCLQRKEENKMENKTITFDELCTQIETIQRQYKRGLIGFGEKNERIFWCKEDYYHYFIENNKK